MNKIGNATVSLVQEGLATVHLHSTDTLLCSRQLYTAEVCRVSMGRFVLECQIAVDAGCFFRLGEGEEA